MNELLKNWNWDVFHIGATLFIILIVSTVIWLIIDSIKINKNGKKGK
jgi:hypothetical protein